VTTPVVSPADWRGADLAQRPDRWVHPLTESEIAELAGAIAHVKSLGKELRQVTAQDFPLVVLRPALADWLERLERGLGFVLVRGFPVRDWSKQDAAIAYWIIGRHLGEPVPQNPAGELLVDVRDTGADKANHSTRLYKTRAELTFHTDGADIIGLQCLRAAKSGGVSRICSSVHVYNEVVRRRPDLVPLMFDTYQHHAHGQFGPEGPPTFAYPIVTVNGAVFRMFLLPWYIRNAAADFPQLAGLSEAQQELLDLLEALPMGDGAALDMSFQPGDMQFLKNSVILHARSNYADDDDPDEKRHLLRLWLTARQFRDGDEFLRQGIGPK
jgi:alpha-ketoglutarate-dependent taurine dioxygenase